MSASKIPCVAKGPFAGIYINHRSTFGILRARNCAYLGRSVRFPCSLPSIRHVTSLFEHAGRDNPLDLCLRQIRSVSSPLLNGLYAQGNTAHPWKATCGDAMARCRRILSLKAAELAFEGIEFLEVEKQIHSRESERNLDSKRANFDQLIKLLSARMTETHENTKT